MTGAGILCLLVLLMAVLLLYAVVMSSAYLPEIAERVVCWKTCEVNCSSLVDHCYRVGYSSDELYAAAMASRTAGRPEWELLRDVALAVELQERLHHAEREQLHQRRPVRAVKHLRGVGA